MRILLLGGTGFVGSYLYGFLKDRHTVIPTFSKSVIEGGLRYNLAGQSFSEIVKGRAFDVVINNINPLNCEEGDLLRSTEGIIEYLLTQQETFYIQISSVSADDRNRENDPYSHKKYLADTLVRDKLPADRYAILRFPQLFDYAGKAKSSQGGLFYLVESVYKGSPINVFPNYRDMRRNYLSVEILVDVVLEAAENRISGVHNILIGHHTLPFSQILDILISFNKGFDRETLLKIGDKKGAEYFIPEPSGRFQSLNQKTESVDGYFKKLYDEYTRSL